MVAYMIFTRVKTTDKEQLEEYSKKVQATFNGHDVTFLSVNSPVEVLFF